MSPCSPFDVRPRKKDTLSGVGPLWLTAELIRSWLASDGDVLAIVPPVVPPVVDGGAVAAPIEQAPVHEPVADTPPPSVPDAPQALQGWEARSNDKHAYLKTNRDGLPTLAHCRRQHLLETEGKSPTVEQLIKTIGIQEYGNLSADAQAVYIAIGAKGTTNVMGRDGKFTSAKIVSLDDLSCQDDFPFH